MRLQEDEIYKLQDYLGEYQEKVRQVRCENAELKQRLDELETASLSGGGKSGRNEDDSAEESLLDRQKKRNSAGDSSKYDPKQDAEEKDADPAPEMPEIEFGAPSKSLTPENGAGTGAAAAAESASEEPPPFKPSAELAEPKPSEPAGDTAPPFDAGSGKSNITLPLLPLGQLPTPLPLAAPISLATNAEPVEPTEHLPGPLARVEFEIIPGEIDASGAQTMRIIVCPRDQANHLTTLKGTAAVLLIDPEGTPETQKLARWDFTAEELAAAWSGVGADRTLELWVGLPPETLLNSRLELWVRVVDATGNKAIAHQLLVTNQPLSEAEPLPSEPAPSTLVPAETGWRAAKSTPRRDSQIRVVSHEEPR